jgi:hypothetical protein
VSGCATSPSGSLSSARTRRRKSATWCPAGPSHPGVVRARSSRRVARGGARSALAASAAAARRLRYRLVNHSCPPQRRARRTKACAATPSDLIHHHVAHRSLRCEAGPAHCLAPAPRGHLPPGRCHCQRHRAANLCIRDEAVPGDCERRHDHQGRSEGLPKPDRHQAPGCHHAHHRHERGCHDESRSR